MSDARVLAIPSAHYRELSRRLPAICYAMWPGPIPTPEGQLVQQLAREVATSLRNYLPNDFALGARGSFRT